MEARGSHWMLSSRGMTHPGESSEAGAGGWVRTRRPRAGLWALKPAKIPDASGSRLPSLVTDGRSCSGEGDSHDPSKGTIRDAVTTVIVVCQGVGCEGLLGRICLAKGRGSFPQHRGRHADLKAELEYPG